MMGRQHRHQASLFYDFTLDDMVAANHLLRRLDVFATAVLGDLHNELQPFYSDVGRPSVDPELMMRMLIVGYGSARPPSKYILTWLPRVDVIAATNRWQTIKSREDAMAIVAGVQSKAKSQGHDARALTRNGASRERSSRALSTKRKSCSAPNDTGDLSQKTAIADSLNDTRPVPKNNTGFVMARRSTRSSWRNSAVTRSISIGSWSACWPC